MKKAGAAGAGAGDPRLAGEERRLSRSQCRHGVGLGPRGCVWGPTAGGKMRRQLLLLGPKRKRGKRARQRLGWRRERIRKQISIRTEWAV